MGTVSGSVKTTHVMYKLTLKSVAVPVTSAACKLNSCSAVEECSHGSTARDSNGLSSDLVFLKCNMNVL